MEVRTMLALLREASHTPAQGLLRRDPPSRQQKAQRSSLLPGRRKARLPRHDGSARGAFLQTAYEKWISKWKFARRWHAMRKGQPHTRRKVAATRSSSRYNKKERHHFLSKGSARRHHFSAGACARRTTKRDGRREALPTHEVCDAAMKMRD
ncbi:hypothetical protein HAX54_026652 [Datura stramonium]|uniref:Uncharacterized protein n=1 Tax=Datura stramonium TaxID=4076 RepID=A0ABS8V1H0_DATST|nr:hypothetical protein [Datura stramonium]